MRPPLLPHQRKLRIVATLGIILILTVVALLPSQRTTPVTFTTCVFHQVSGLPCPLCGGTRAAGALLRGDASRAFSLNPLAFPAIAALLGCALLISFEAVRGKPLTDWPRLLKRAQPWFPLVLILLALWWLPHIWSALRNSKTELLDLRNPIARDLHQRLRTPSP